MAKTPKRAISVRLLPAAMATVGALLALKTVAMAEDVAETTTATPTAAHAEEHAEAGATSTAAAPANQCQDPTFAELAGLSQAEVQVLQALQARRATLDQRGAALETQGELMTVAEQRLAERVAELRRLEATVNDLLGHLDEAQEQRLTNLVDVYQRMRAKDAAAVFDGLDDGVLVQVASRMRQANLAEVMGRMDPVRARTLTQMLADRARPPTGGADLLARANAGAPQAPAATAPGG
jgi:flagellar motility protein MotE (MotC chaperone)